MNRLDKAVGRQSAPVISQSESGEKVKGVLQRRPHSEDQKWCFSFRFFRQIENFGLSNSSVEWVSSVLERLQDLSTHRIDDLEEERIADGYRYHPINWHSKNIPIEQDSLDWIRDDYRKNPDEFPILQFMVSKAKGRIVGFFDEENIFQIVLLDPLHNIQPSKDFGYRVDPCSPVSCEFTRLHHAVQDAMLDCDDPNCRARHNIAGALKERGWQESYSVLMMRLDDPQKVTDAEDLIQSGKVKTYADIFEEGLCRWVLKD